MNAYSIKQASKKTGLTEDAIRYYEKIGLLPYAKRKRNGHRIYDEEDIELMELIICLKKTGMSLNEMKNILQYPVKYKLSSVPELKRTLLEYKEKVMNQIHDLQRIVEFIDSKLENDETLFRPQKNKGNKNG
ncbi:MerR family transcriptional regulator [Bacillus safensis]|uniref:HTH merR-type domain-containing protein n=3 Tax=Bacillaceae TaxID=186817 RepID=A0A920BUW6_9BACI|nr:MULTISPECIES: MerR family transcriptional regulator [Bacillaceae]PAE18528.1 MerR family transcriptional regulator [Bacillus sp. 7504-2]APJ09840.1 MerR family transcriptional regulator [Bacillus safensis]KAB3538036.1 MerR family transcriptional regulator [Bacillus safensis]KAB3543975.1 MerR family transcriptional regulator [Bacillus safensis]MBG9817395.1 MerR family transcriptional regulator [Bacillus safensis]